MYTSDRQLLAFKDKVTELTESNDANYQQGLFLEHVTDLLTWYIAADSVTRMQLTNHFAGFLDLYHEDYEPIDPED